MGRFASLFILSLALIGCQAPFPPPRSPLRVAPVRISAPDLHPDLSNVVNRDLMPALSESEKKSLGENGLLVRPSQDKEFFHAYLNNDAPLVTSDSVLHAYHILFEDACENCERLVLQPDLSACLDIASRQLQAWDAPEARRIIAALQAALHSESAPVDSESWGVAWKPPANRARAALRLGSQSSLLLSDDRDLRTALILSYSLAAARPRLARVLQWNRWLAGQPEDVGPLQLLDLATPIFGSHLLAADLQEEGKWALLREALEQLPRPRVCDTPQDAARGRAGLRYRIFPPGVTEKSLAFQAAVDARTWPGSSEVLTLLADHQRVERGVDLHHAMLGVLYSLGELQTFGCIRREAWEAKTSNARLGGWAELEHDLQGYTKDNGSYLGGYDHKLRFAGYVEPNPAFFANLQNLVAQLRGGLEGMGVFVAVERDATAQIRAYREQVLREIPRLRKELSLKNPEEYLLNDLPNSTTMACRRDFLEFEALLQTLGAIATKEVEGRPLDDRDRECLLGYGESLKGLALIHSNIDEPREPIGSVVSVISDEALNRRRYAAVGRPLRLLAVVPSEGQLYYCQGSIYSYYQLDRPLSPLLTDREWKACSEVPEKPWLLGPR